MYPDDGQVGNFRRDPEYIAIFGAENRGLHIVKPAADFAKNNGFMHNPTIGGHYAITVGDIGAVKARLDEAGTLYTDAGTYAMAGTRQVYVLDPKAGLSNSTRSSIRSQTHKFSAGLAEGEQDGLS